MNRPRAFRYRGADVDPAAAGRELGVGAVLTGRVRQHSGTVAVQIDMIDAATGDQLWGGHYTRPMTDVFRIQEDIAADVIEKLRGRAAPPPRSRLRPRTERGDAYRHYLKGRYYWNKRSPEGFRLAAAEFMRAIDIDPAYAPAHAGLADAYVLMGNTAWGSTPPEEAFPAARAAALKALSLDEGLAAAHTSLAMVQMYFDRDWAAAEQSYRHALALDPDDIVAHMYYALLLSALLRLDEALVAIRRAHQLDPLSLTVGACLGLIHEFRGELDESRDALEAVLALEPTFHVAHSHLCGTYEKLGDLKRMLASAQRNADGSDSPNVVAVLGWAQGVSGLSDDAHAQLARLEAMAARGIRVPAHDVGLVWLGLRDFDRALACFNRAVDERASMVIFFAVLPWLDPLRGDPRFAALLDRIGLTPALQRRSARTC